MAVTRLQSQAQGSAISAELWAQVDGEKERLFVLMEQVQKKLQKKSEGRAVTADLRCCKWDQVMQEVDRTADGWTAASKKSSKVAAHLDKIKQNAAAFESWLELLPTGDYGSSICGVFRLVLAAAGQAAKVERTVFEALSDIPYTMASARKYLDIYRDIARESLEKMTFDLFRAVIGALTRIMEFFGDSTFKKAYEPLLTQSTYKRELFESLDAIKTHMARIKEEADQLLAVRQRSLGTVMSATHTVASQTHENSEQTLHMLQSIYGILVHGNGGTGNRFIQSMESQTQRLAPDGFISATETASHDRSSRPAERNSDRQGPATDLAQTLLALLVYQPDVVIEDISACLRLGQLLDDEPKARAAAMVRHDGFKTFLVEDQRSSALLVNGRADLAIAEGISPLTRVAAELAQTISSASPAFSVAYLCDQHRPVFGVASSPLLELMTSLVGQLLSQMRERGIEANLAFLTDADWHSLKRRKLNVMCVVFRELVGQLSAGVVVCIIDEPTVYEMTSLHRDATDTVIRRLVRMANNRRDGVIFKLLVTCHDRALGISQYFLAPGQTIDMEQEVEADDSAEWYIARLGT